MQELGGLGWVWGVWEQGEEMGKVRDGFGVMGMEGWRDSGMTGRGVGRRGSAAPQEVWEGAVLSPTYLGSLQSLSPGWECPAVLGADQNLGMAREMEFVAVTPVKHLEIENGTGNIGYSFLREMRKNLRAKILGSERRKCRIKCLTQVFPNPLETLSTLADKFCAVQAWLLPASHP